MLKKIVKLIFPALWLTAMLYFLLSPSPDLNSEYLKIDINSSILWFVFSLLPIPVYFLLLKVFKKKPDAKKSGMAVVIKILLCILLAGSIPLGFASVTFASSPITRYTNDPANIKDFYTEKLPESAVSIKLEYLERNTFLTNYSYTSTSWVLSAEDYEKEKDRMKSLEGIEAFNDEKNELNSSVMYYYLNEENGKSIGAVLFFDDEKRIARFISENVTYNPNDDEAIRKDLQTAYIRTEEKHDH